MTHVAMHKLCKRHRRQHARVSDSMVLAVLLFFFKTQLLVNMSLLACHKLERTDKATVTYSGSFRSSLPSRALFYRVRYPLLSSLSISFSLAKVGSDTLVLGPFFPTLSISFDSDHLI